MTNTNPLYRKFPDGCNQALQISQAPAKHLEVPRPFAFEKSFCQRKMNTVITVQKKL